MLPNDNRSLSNIEVSYVYLRADDSYTIMNIIKVEYYKDVAWLNNKTY